MISHYKNYRVLNVTVSSNVSPVSVSTNGSAKSSKDLSEKLNFWRCCLPLFQLSCKKVSISGNCQRSAANSAKDCCTRLRSSTWKVCLKAALAVITLKSLSSCSVGKSTCPDTLAAYFCNELSLN